MILRLAANAATHTAGGFVLGVLAVAATVATAKLAQERRREPAQGAHASEPPEFGPDAAST